MDGLDKDKRIAELEAERSRAADDFNGIIHEHQTRIRKLEQQLMATQHATMADRPSTPERIATLRRMLEIYAESQHYPAALLLQIDATKPNKTGEGRLHLDHLDAKVPTAAKAVQDALRDIAVFRPTLAEFIGAANAVL